MTTSVIVAGNRTPIGKFNGGLSTLSGVELGTHAIKSVLETTKIDPKLIDYVILGQVLTAGAGQLPARQASLNAGLSWETPAISINKVCLSGLSAIGQADMLIKTGQFDTIIAGGQESMSQAPHILPKARKGLGYGEVTLLDSIYFDALRDVSTNQSMGALTEEANKVNGFTRLELDEFALASHQKATEAWKKGYFNDEVCPIEIPQRKGNPVIFNEDEGIRFDITLEALAKLPPAFSKDGVLTAGNSSPLNDGACAIIIMSKEKAESLGIEYLAEIVSFGYFAGPDSTLQLQPSGALKDACKRADIKVSELKVVEINEAFAAVGLASMRDLDLKPEVVNPNGGAIALGHPLGMSGARIALHAALEGKRRGGGYVGATLCGGGGQGDAIILKV